MIIIRAIINEFYKDIQKAGGGKWDTSSLLKRIENQTKNNFDEYTNTPYPITIKAEAISSESISVGFRLSIE